MLLTGHETDQFNKECDRGDSSLLDLERNLKIAQPCRFLLTKATKFIYFGLS